MGTIKVSGLSSPVGKAADVNNLRFALANVLIEVATPCEPGKESAGLAVATDGRMLAAVPCRVSHGPELSDDEWSRPLAAGSQAFIAAKQLEKKALKNELRTFLAAPAGQPSTLNSTKSGVPSMSIVETASGRFPNWRGVLRVDLVEDAKPTIDETVIQLGLNAKYLASLADAIGSEGGEVVLTFKASGESPIVVESMEGDAIGVLMPLGGSGRKRSDGIARTRKKIEAINPSPSL